MIASEFTNVDLLMLLTILGLLIVLIFLAVAEMGLSRMSKPPADFGTVAKIGEYFFTEFLFPFEAISILLIIAVIGAVVLARTVVSRPTSGYDQPSVAEHAGEGGSDDHAGGEKAHGTHGGH